MTLAIALLTAAARADDECLVRSLSGGAEVRVAPDGTPPFSLGLYNTALTVHLGGAHDGLVVSSSPLAFSAALAERHFYVKRAMDLAAGMVHVEPGARLLDVSAGLVAKLVLDEISVEALQLPCDGLELANSHAEPPAAPAEGRAVYLRPRGKTVTLHERSDGGTSLVLTFFEPVDAPLQELEVRGVMHRLRFAQAYGWLTGWVDIGELVKTKPKKHGDGSIFGNLGSQGARADGYCGPAVVAAGTVVYSRSGGRGRWASVPNEVTLEVIAKKDAA